MRCEDVIRELATAIDGQTPPALAEHLDACSSCAEWLDRSAGLDRLWARTRPQDPSAEAWNAVWNNIEQSIDARSHEEQVGPASGGIPHPHTMLKLAAVDEADEVQPSDLPVSPRREIGRWSFGTNRLFRRGLLYGAAASLLLGLALPELSRRVESLRNSSPAISLVNGSPSQSSDRASFVDIEEGDLVMIHASDTTEGTANGPVEVTTIDPGNGIDPWYVMLNEFEAMATPLVAAR